MNDKQLFIKMALDGWQGQIKATNNLLDKLTDEQLMNEIAPSKNRGVYLLGHLVAVHDMMLALLRFEEAMYPELKPIFIDVPDKSFEEIPSITDLREQWKIVNEKLADHFNALVADEWFTRHASVSEEDFVKEPHRNRLNVVLGRTSHLASHRGQLLLLKDR